VHWDVEHCVVKTKVQKTTSGPHEKRFDANQLATSGPTVGWSNLPLLMLIVGSRTLRATKPIFSGLFEQSIRKDPHLSLGGLLPWCYPFETFDKTQSRI
jgi:hypothetical protein